MHRSPSGPPRWWCWRNGELWKGVIHGGRSTADVSEWQTHGCLDVPIDRDSTEFRRHKVTCRVITYLQNTTVSAKLHCRRLNRASMAVVKIQKLRNLRSTRDFRAELLSVAASMANESGDVSILVESPAISEETIRREWERFLAVVRPAISQRLELQLGGESSPSRAGRQTHAASRYGIPSIPLERPNYKAEVLRVLVGASFANDGMWSVKNLIQTIGSSQTPIRQALNDLKLAGLVTDWGRGDVDLVPEDLTAQSLAKLQAAPQAMHFRFRRGAQIRSPAALLERALPLLRSDREGPWANMALSGVAVAQEEIPNIDLAGLPRLDLVAFVPRAATSFDAKIMRRLSDELEHEPSVLAPTPVAVTLVRADEAKPRLDVIKHVRCASEVDVFLALLDLNLRQQAAQYATTVRQ